MSKLPLNPSSERGVALIIVLLLLAVMSGLATGMSVNSQIEVAMSSNEMFYAGARAAAEAGLNRAVTAIVKPANNGENLLYGDDNVAGTADDGNMGYIMSGFTGWPSTLGVTAQYSYTVEVLDDDNNALYATALTPAQLLQMGENGNPANNINDRLIVRATGFGPQGTLVRVARLLESVDSTSPGTTTPSYSNPAILVNGDFAMDGRFNIHGDEGNVHANGNLVVTGTTGRVEGDLTAVGTMTAAAGIAAGMQSGGARTINVPPINAADYMAQADFFLNADGTKTVGSAGGAACVALCNGWTFSGGQWSISGSTAPEGTFYVNGTVSISGSPGSNATPKALSIIATGSISITGRPFLTPDGTNNPGLLQFVTNGDLMIGGAVDVNAPNTVEGKCLVREQLQISGNPTLQGQIIVQNVTTGTLSNLVQTNSLSGSVEIEYNGSFQPINTPVYTPGVTTYANTVSGWIE